MSYVIMELTGRVNEYNDVRYCIGVECDYIIKDKQIELINPRIHYREIMGVFIYIDGTVGYDVNVPSINKDIQLFRDVLDKLMNDMEFNKKVYNHFFVEMTTYPEDVFEGIYYEFN